MAVVDFWTFLGYQGNVSDILPLAKVYHDALVDNGVDKYTWEDFKKDMIIQLYEIVIKTFTELNSLPPKEYDKMMNLFGEKSAQMLQMFSCGAMGWIIIILTDFYIQNKEGFLDPHSFSDI